MTDPHIFMMGNFEARIPADRRYFESHVWAQPAGDVLRIGFTSYAVRLLQDVYFLDWQIDPGTQVRRKQTIGEIESSKAVSTMYAPADGQIVRFNEALLNDPSLINADPYERGWLYEMTTNSSLLAPEDYLKVLESGWEQTQRLLKNQFNE
ncbi:glycine cleavage system protein H [Schlesneria paludicola]|uniref:glycine cleavage system protein H n=1 Tax=Schlesneria paludicola TaxID=360056 RepID=UPI00029AFEC9|nr:glycine cleavage system protein H [Schlesneria paludicola]